MRRLVFTLCTSALALVPAFPTRAERPVTLEQFRYSADQGYILVWVGPMKGRKTFPGWLDFMQISTETGLTTRTDNGELRTINARAIKDAAAVYDESKPLVTRDDSGLFLIPVKPGRWVVGGANGTALTLGSYAFNVPVGAVTYLGKVIVGNEDGSSQVPEIRARAESPETSLIKRSALMFTTIVFSYPKLSDVPHDALPASASDRLIAAEIEKNVRFNNYLGGVINRAADLGPMPHADPVSRVKGDSDR